MSQSLRKDPAHPVAGSLLCVPSRVKLVFHPSYSAPSQLHISVRQDWITTPMITCDPITMGIPVHMLNPTHKLHEKSMSSPWEPVGTIKCR